MARFNGSAGLGSLSDRMSDSPESVDRGLMIACAVVWLLTLGAGVAAIVALVDLGRGHAAGESGSDTPWLLYTIIGISAVVIAAAVPLLLRARRGVLDATTAAQPDPAAAAAVDVPGRVVAPAARSTAKLPAAIVDRMWLRCGFGVLTATGVAMFAVALAAYLLAVDADTWAWVALGIAAAITTGMAAIPVLLLRQLQAALAV